MSFVEARFGAYNPRMKNRKGHFLSGGRVAAVAALTAIWFLAGCGSGTQAPEESSEGSGAPAAEGGSSAEASASASAKTGPVVGAIAPDISFVNLTSGAMEKLSDFRGKVVVIDFWASWCPPCQKPMSKMQTYKAKHPEFGDKAVFLALSIDSTRGAAVSHLKEKGWDKTHNVWGKPAVAEAFDVSGIPTVFILDTEGKIVKTGHPNSIDIPETVGELLAAK